MNAARPSAAYRRYVLGIMACVSVLNVMDRQVIAVLIEPIKHDLEVSDRAMGLLSGTAFAIFHALASIPIAMWADRWVRRTIVSLGLTLWSGLTLATGYARGFSEMFLIRIGVGIGETTGASPAQSLLSDYFPAQRRSTALAVLIMGGSVGSIVAYLGGGWLAEAFGWRTVFIVFGALGLLFAPLLHFSVREPARGQSDPGAADSSALPLGEGLRSLLRHASFRHLILGIGLCATASYALLTWSAPFLTRVHGLSTGEAGTFLALGYGLSGAVGMLAGGWIVDALLGRDVRWMVWAPALASMLAAPFAWTFLLAPTPGLALIAVIPTSLLNSFYLGPLYAVAQNLASLRTRALAAALLALSNSVMGLGIAPPLVGWLTDVLAEDLGPQAIRYSISALLLVHFWSGLHLWLAGRTLRSDLRRGQAAD
ncbi:MAG: MFS transporter [Proteobacteria bacterium]|nr:MFS transporter [Pseudomonadota bacterium]